MSQPTSFKERPNQGVMSSLSDGIDIKQYAGLVLRWSWLIVLCALLAGAGAYMVSINTTPIYRTSSRLMINERRSATVSNYSDILASERSARTYAQLMQRGTIRREAFVQLGLDPDAVSAGVTSVQVTPVRDTQLVNLIVEGTSPKLITAVANVLPQVFVTELRTVQSARFAESKSSLEQQLDTLTRQIEEAQVRVTDLESRTRNSQEEVEYGRLANTLSQYLGSYSTVLRSYEEIRLAEIQSQDTVVVVEPASEPTSPVRPRPRVNTLLAAFIGAMLALGTIFLIEFLDDRVRTPEDLRRIADVTVLGGIGKSPLKAGGGKDRSEGIVSLTQPRHPIVEAYRRLRTNLQYVDVDSGVKAIAVSSANAGEGKSTTAANLAVVMAQSGHSVVLVDADLRKPVQHKIFGVQQRPGLAEALLSPTPYDLCQPVPGAPNLRVMTCGDRVPNPAEVLGSKRMHQLVEELQQSADLVVFDTPPLLAVTDAQVVGRFCNGVVIVIDTQKTSRGAVHRALESLIQVNVPIVGAVLNRLSSSGRGYYYYYYSADYYYSDNDGDGDRPQQQPERQQAAAPQQRAPQPRATSLFGERIPRQGALPEQVADS